jgi:hypothetical protein
MREVSPLTATIDWAGGTATVTIRGQVDAITRSQLREWVAWISESGPRRLVLDLVQVTGPAREQAGMLVAAVRRQLPAACFLDVRLAPPAGAATHYPRSA